MKYLDEISGELEKLLSVVNNYYEGFGEFDEDEVLERLEEKFEDEGNDLLIAELNNYKENGESNSGLEGEVENIKEEILREKFINFYNKFREFSSYNYIC